jgi:predicted nucleic acid-binding protein
MSRDRRERDKARVANEILREPDLGLSVQVLQEFYVQVTRATRSDRLTHRQAADLVRSFTRFPVQETTTRLVAAAIETHERFGLSYWDAAIVEAARSLGCDVVLTEDLAHAQDYGGVTVVDPFR